MGHNRLECWDKCPPPPFDIYTTFRAAIFHPEKVTSGELQTPQHRKSVNTVPSVRPQRNMVLILIIVFTLSCDI